MGQVAAALSFLGLLTVLAARNASEVAGLICGWFRRFPCLCRLDKVIFHFGEVEVEKV